MPTISNILNPVLLSKKVIDYYIKRPKLIMYVDPEDAYIESTDPEFGEAPGNYACVKVRNIGGVKARDCMVELRSIEQREGERFHRIKAYKHINKEKTGHTDCQSKNIEKGIDLITQNISNCNLNVIFQHFFSF